MSDANAPEAAAATVKRKANEALVIERLRAFEIADSDLDVLNAVVEAQKWVAGHPSTSDNDPEWVRDFCFMVLGMLDTALGAGATETIFAGIRKSASLLMVLLTELQTMIAEANGVAIDAIADLTETVVEE